MMMLLLDADMLGGAVELVMESTKL